MLGVVQPQERAVGLVGYRPALEDVGKALAHRLAAEARVAQHGLDVGVVGQQVGVAAVPQAHPGEGFRVADGVVLLRRVERGAPG